MHPQIERQGPGACPICGMALERRQASLGQSRCSGCSFCWQLQLWFMRDFPSFCEAGPRLRIETEYVHLDLLGTGAAYGYSVYALFFANSIPATFRMLGKLAVNFEPAAVIITLVLLGQVLELRARSHTSSAIKNLLELAPKIARSIRDDGVEEDVPLDRIQVGNRLRVRPGEDAG